MSQHEVLVERFARGLDDAWTLTVLTGPDAALELPSAGCAVPLAELYEDVEPPPRRPHLRAAYEPASPAYAAGPAVT